MDRRGPRQSEASSPRRGAAGDRRIPPCRQAAVLRRRRAPTSPGSPPSATPRRTPLLLHLAAAVWLRTPRARTRARTAARERASSRYLERATPCAVPLIPRRVALAARVGTAAEDAVRVDRDRLRAAGDLGPLAEVCDLVAPRREPLSRRLAEARFHLERTSRPVIPARLLDGLLHLEAQIDDAHRQLEVRL